MGESHSYCSTGKLSITVGIVSANRRAILQELLPYLAVQSRAPDKVVICVPSADDLPDLSSDPRLGAVQTLVGKRGISPQRNHLLETVDDSDIVLFIDDDFLMHRDYLLELEKLFRDDPGVVMATGTVLADGITGPGINFTEAAEILGRTDSLDHEEQALIKVYNGYGCNMAVRMQSVRQSGARFDEMLPLYGWLEDVDFSRQLADCGRIVRSRRMLGIHLGTKAGRQSGRRFGYSQIANPVYLTRKNTMSRNRAWKLMARNICANAVKLLWPEPWVDRKGRFVGNILGLRDLIRGQLSPEKIMAMD